MKSASRAAATAAAVMALATLTACSDDVTSEPPGQEPSSTATPGSEDTDRADGADGGEQAVNRTLATLSAKYEAAWQGAVESTPRGAGLVTAVKDSIENVEWADLPAEVVVGTGFPPSGDVRLTICASADGYAAVQELDVDNEGSVKNPRYVSNLKAPAPVDNCVDKEPAEIQAEIQAETPAGVSPHAD